MTTDFCLKYFFGIFNVYWNSGRQNIHLVRHIKFSFMLLNLIKFG